MPFLTSGSADKHERIVFLFFTPMSHHFINQLQKEHILQQNDAPLGGRAMNFPVPWRCLLPQEVLRSHWSDLKIVAIRCLGARLLTLSPTTIMRFSRICHSALVRWFGDLLGFTIPTKSLLLSPGPIELVQWSMCLASVTLQNASVIGSLRLVARPGIQSTWKTSGP